MIKREHDRCYYKKHHQKCLERKRRYRETHREELQQKQALYRQTHPALYAEWRRTIPGYLRTVFHNMKNRCTRVTHPSYENYGGRGIKCFFTSTQFVRYVMGKLQVDPRGLQIDRIDNNGHYEPGNIRFVTRSENCKNRRTTNKLAR